MIATNKIELSYNRNIQLELLDARTVKVTTNCAFTENEYKDSEIIQINYANQHVFNIGNIISFKLGEDFEMNFKFNIQQIKEFDGYYILYSHIRTKSSYFLMPMLGYNKEWFKWNQFFINAYSICPDYNLDDDYLYLLYKYMPLEQYNNLEKLQIKLDTFVEIKYPENKDEVVFVHKIPKKYAEDINKFYRGKYSQIDDITKRQILYFHNTKRDGELGQILFRDDKRKKQLEFDFKCKIPEGQDLWDIPQEEEILTLI